MVKAANALWDSCGCLSHEFCRVCEALPAVSVMIALSIEAPPTIGCACGRPNFTLAHKSFNRGRFNRHCHVHLMEMEKRESGTNYIAFSIHGRQNDSQTRANVIAAIASAWAVSPPPRLRPISRPAPSIRVRVSPTFQGGQSAPRLTFSQRQS